jgi:hypothetical protein
VASTIEPARATIATRREKEQLIVAGDLYLKGLSVANRLLEAFDHCGSLSSRGGGLDSTVA